MQNSLPRSMTFRLIQAPDRYLLWLAGSNMLMDSWSQIIQSTVYSPICLSLTQILNIMLTTYKIPKILASPHFPVLEGLLPLTVTEVHSADQTVM